MTIPVAKLKRRWMKEAGFKEGYDALDDEFSVRLEGASSKPSLATLERFAKATGMRVQLSFVPVKRQLAKGGGKWVCK